MKFSMCLDSGAYTFYERRAKQLVYKGVSRSANEWAKHLGLTPSSFKQRYKLHLQNPHEFPKSELFESKGIRNHRDYYEQYLDSYVAFCNKYDKSLDFYVTLDWLFNPEKSFEWYLKMLAKGARPVPVLHFGTDIKWLKKYLDKTDYVCLGGRSRPTTYQDYIGWAASMFRYIGSKATERQEVKVHGLAAMSPRMLTHFPWYSVDSATAFHHATCGMVHIPQLDKGKTDFLVPLTRIVFSQRSSDSSIYYSKLPQDYQREVKSYFDKLNVTVDSQQTYHGRNITNLYFFFKLGEAVGERRGWPLKLYVSGQPSGGAANVSGWTKLIADLGRTGLTRFDFMGSFFRKSHALSLLKTMRSLKDTNGNHDQQRTSRKLYQAADTRRLHLVSEGDRQVFGAKGRPRLHQ